VETPLHSHNIYTAQLTKDKLSLMTFDGRHREIGYILIWKLFSVSYF
jgi:hypothetical protein